MSTEADKEVDNYLDLDDDAFSEMGLPGEFDESSEETNEDSTEEDAPTDDNEKDTEDNLGEDTDSEAEASDNEETDGEIEESDDVPDNDENTENLDSDDKSSSDALADSTENEEEEEKEVDTKSELAELYKPFKANNKMIQVNNIEDARTLMQKGANYEKKMAGLKQHLRVVKMLENNNLLDESKINYLIDLDKKNPDAVSKLLKDSGVDPLDVDLEKKNEYTPNTYNVNDKEIELDSVLDDIKESSGFSTTIDVISNKWDDSSKEVLFANPEIIRFINGHVESGIYDQINTVVETEKMMGRLSGLSDIEAYRQVGDTLQKNGAFNKAPATSDKEKQSTEESEEDKAKIKDKKKAASPTKRAAPKKSKDADFNPLSLSDADFQKMAESKFL